MPTGLDHFIVVAPDPDVAAQRLEDELGLRADPGGRHEAYGTFNRLIWLGDSYVEILGIADRSLAAAAWFGPRAMQLLDQSGGGYVGLALASDDLTADLLFLHGQGSRLGDVLDGQRHRPDGGTVRWKVASGEADPELGCLFLIEHDETGAEWAPADRAERARQAHPLGGPARLERVELPVGDVRATSMRLHREIGLAFRPSLAGEGARESSVARQALRLVRAGAGRAPTVVVRGGASRRQADLFGCRWLIEPSAAA
ncbi:MAG TPA: VOC family protein [Candidatus Limnocylindrales bacterium]|nr:VOC family protein [Candidatus Limnocylindrales bacterium]